MAKRGPKPKRTPPPPPDGGPLWQGFELPADLTECARAEVARLVLALASVGTLGRTDPRVVVCAARTHDLIERASAGIDSLTVKTAHGGIAAHPLLAVVNTLTMRLRGLWSDMGLTPATAKLGSDAKAETEANPWDGLLNLHTG